jgi:type III pantothenate kinase
MFLAVDIGNSNIKFGIFNKEQLLSKFSIPTNRYATVNELTSAIGLNLQLPIDEIMICSVVPEVENSLAEFLQNSLKIEPVFVKNHFDFGLKINHVPLSAAGADRLINSFAAVELYGVPCIVCSFGTATTVDVVDRHRTLVGGIIAPGIATMAKALHQNTARLPQVGLEKPSSVLGTTTFSAIQSGIFHGHVAMVEGLIGMIKREIDDNVQVIATGGFSGLIAESTGQIDLVNENLTFEGLKAIHLKLADKNRK